MAWKIYFLFHLSDNGISCFTGQIRQRTVPGDNVILKSRPHSEKLHLSLIIARKDTEILAIPTGFLTCKQ